ncbi:sigma-54-dependent transcriptional regulator [Candidatus Thiothrix anitrata]|uniref:Sigma-54-dependent Fis family transcriptional regulator n=1 Tax=Candidatus Thiothrix anitrata TaxID=2823902 RepID=A0ABX7X505_9GAMM|nr:sigma-54 dependent transcriptional regulator [Candidatus Thiothrix anitrata]QTR50965.1 sigma-54-dependent Fis family transcriptional regulator [Candidatus Thiothrix anitrata]
MPEQTVLIVDGNPAERERLELTLLRMGLDTLTAPSIADAVTQAARYPPFLCLTELTLPDGDGLALLQQMHQQQPPVPVAFISGSATVNSAVAAMKAGALDVIPKPLELARLRELLQTVLHPKPSKARKSAVSATSDTHQSSIIGNAPIMQQLQVTIRKLARGQVPVYIHGESGSGKERVAHAIHQQGARANAPFIPVNCGAIPENLMESEFFGHKKGSFTGAVTDKQGLFQAAHKGTLFLDEVADLPLIMQVKLLRAIQEGAVKPVGGLEEIPVNVRILSATHKALEDEVLAGRFRQDLYYRLNVIKLDVPPLRERQDDILLLADVFLQRIAERWQTASIVLSPAARAALLTYTFPGNVRELENILERACTLCDDDLIEVKDLRLQAMRFDQPATVTVQPIPPVEEQPQAIEGDLLPDDVWNPEDEDAERDLVLRALDYTRWNRTRAARILGMTFRQLGYRIQKYGLDESEEGL